MDEETKQEFMEKYSQKNFYVSIYKLIKNIFIINCHSTIIFKIIVCEIIVILLRIIYFN